MVLLMKKLLGIMVLGLLLSGNAYAETITKDGSGCLSSTKMWTPECSPKMSEQERYERSQKIFHTHRTLKRITDEKNKKTSHIVKGISSDRNEYIFDFMLGTIFECVKVPRDWEICDKYKISETSSNGVVAEISYNDFADRLGKKQFGGKKKFYRKYSKRIKESKKSCNCENPIYKKFILDLQTGKTYKVFHPYSKKVKLDDEFRLKYKKNYYKFEDVVSKITIDHIMLAAAIYDVVNSGGDILKSSKKSSSSVSSSSTVTKSLGSGSGSGSVLDREFGGQSLKRLIAYSRR